MRLLLVPLLAVASLAHADLYRWVDPESGSVKLSNTPPPWYERGGGPAVERIPYTGAAVAPTSPAAPQRVDPAAARRREDELKGVVRTPPAQK